MAETLALIPDLLEAGGKVITWGLTTYPINIAVVGSVVGVVCGIVASAKSVF